MRTKRSVFSMKTWHKKNICIPSQAMLVINNKCSAHTSSMKTNTFSCLFAFLTLQQWLVCIQLAFKTPEELCFPIFLRDLFPTSFQPIRENNPDTTNSQSRSNCVVQIGWGILRCKSQHSPNGAENNEITKYALTKSAEADSAGLPKLVSRGVAYLRWGKWDYLAPLLEPPHGE